MGHQNTLSDHERKKIRASMNKELIEWVKEKQKGLAHRNETVQPPQKEPKGKCEICHQKKATFACLKCGKSVCTSDYFKIIGICRTCIPEDQVEKWIKKYPNWEKILEVEWVD